MNKNRLLGLCPFKAATQLISTRELKFVSAASEFQLFTGSHVALMHLTWTIPVGETREMFLDDRRSANMDDGETLLMARYTDCGNL